jgi:hypothetical protein
MIVLKFDRTPIQQKSFKIFANFDTYFLVCYILPHHRESRPRDLSFYYPHKQVRVLFPEIGFLLPSGFSLRVVTPQHLAERNGGSPRLFDCSIQNLLGYSMSGTALGVPFNNREIPA